MCVCVCVCVCCVSIDINRLADAPLGVDTLATVVVVIVSCLLMAACVRCVVRLYD